MYKVVVLCFLFSYSANIYAAQLSHIDRALIYYQHGEYANFCYWAEKSNEKTPWVLYNLGDIYLNGKGVATNSARAVVSFDQCMKFWNNDELNGHDKDAVLSSAVMLGMCHLIGSGVDKDEQKAQEYFIKAADRGNPVAQMSLGEISQDKKEFDVAIIWYKKVLDNFQSDDAQKRLARKKIEILMNQKSPTDGMCRIFTLPGGVEMEMVHVAPGKFNMGSDSGQEDENPVHTVRITKGYWIGKYPVTQAQWGALVEKNGVMFGSAKGEPKAWFSSQGGGRDTVTSDFPMEGISWNDCDTLVKALNSKESTSTRWMIPTEAQWEFAARGGNKSKGYMYSGGDNLKELGWYYDNSGDSSLSEEQWILGKSNRNRPHSVQEKNVGNELGIVGMSGNVWEWCRDTYDSGYYQQCKVKGMVEDPCNVAASGVNRVLRGGGWRGSAGDCRSANRDRDGPGSRDSSCGFRLACSAGPHENLTE